jgi:hypothetical protein
MPSGPPTRFPCDVQTPVHVRVGRRRTTGFLCAMWSAGHDGVMESLETVLSVGSPVDQEARFHSLCSQELRRGPAVMRATPARLRRSTVAGGLRPQCGAQLPAERSAVGPAAIVAAG